MYAYTYTHIYMYKFFYLSTNIYIYVLGWCPGPDDNSLCRNLHQETDIPSASPVGERANLFPELGFGKAAIIRPWAPPQDDHRISRVSLALRSNQCSLKKETQNDLHFPGVFSVLHGVLVRSWTQRALMLRLRLMLDLGFRAYVPQQLSVTLLFRRP